MNISLILNNKDKPVRPGFCIPQEAINNKLDTEQKEFILESAHFNVPADSKMVVVTGHSYVIGKTKYLLAGYGLLMALTPVNTLIPMIRVAKGKEKDIKDTIIRNKSYWPYLIEIDKVEETEFCAKIAKYIKKRY